MLASGFLKPGNLPYLFPVKRQLMQSTPCFTPTFKQAMHIAQLNRIKKKYPDKKGYVVREDYSLANDLQVDLYVKSKSGKVTLFEVFVHSYREKEKRRKFKRILEIARERGYEFHTADVLLPALPDIEIEWLENALVNYLTKRSDVIKFGKQSPLEYRMLNVRVTYHFSVIFVFDICRLFVHNLTLVKNMAKVGKKTSTGEAVAAGGFKQQPSCLYYRC
ncbi:MAG: hypothetical protein GY862_13705 [Gammaproteobacteria bacterium]|nr:hypothetical protein [Gammaproteobacteria bacterium]